MCQHFPGRSRISKRFLTCQINSTPWKMSRLWNHTAVQTKIYSANSNLLFWSSLLPQRCILKKPSDYHYTSNQDCVLLFQSATSLQLPLPLSPFPRHSKTLLGAAGKATMVSTEVVWSAPGPAWYRSSWDLTGPMSHNSLCWKNKCCQSLLLENVHRAFSPSGAAGNSRPSAAPAGKHFAGPEVSHFHCHFPAPRYVSRRELGSL